MPLLTGQFEFDPARSVEVQLDNRNYSLIQQMARRVNMTLGGARITIFDTDAEGGFVEEEAGEKPVAEQVVSSASVALREWARIVPVSNRIVDSNPDGVLGVIEQSAYSGLARALDSLAFTGAGVTGGAADSLASVTKTTALQGGAVGESNGTWSGLNNGLKLLADDSKEWTGSLWDMRTEVTFNTDVDAQGRPLYVDVPLSGTNVLGNRPGRVLGRPADFAKRTNSKTGALVAADVVGYAGDWNRAVWGTVGDIKFAVSNEASWTQTESVEGVPTRVTRSAFQHNVTLFRVEALIGFKVLDPDAFVKFTLGTPAA